MKPRHESQRTRSSYKGTEPFDKLRALSLPKRQDSVIGSVNCSVSDLYALCHKKVSTGSVIYAG